MTEQKTELRRATEVMPPAPWEPGAKSIAPGVESVPERLYGWQRKVLELCSMPRARVAVATPNEAGKTSVVVPAVGLGWMKAFPGCRVVSTAGIARQILAHLWPELRRLCVKEPGWKITNDLMLTMPSVDGLPGSTWGAFTSRDARYGEGWHARWFRGTDGVPAYAPLVVIVDCARHLEEEMSFALEMRCSPDVMLLISTPGDDEGVFYHAMCRKAHWERLWVEWGDCPHLCRGDKLAERVKAIAERGPGDPFVRNWIFGKFAHKAALTPRGGQDGRRCNEIDDE